MDEFTLQAARLETVVAGFVGTSPGCAHMGVPIIRVGASHSLDSFLLSPVSFREWTLSTLRAPLTAVAAYPHRTGAKRVSGRTSLLGGSWMNRASLNPLY
jgi:hypothetical protein